MIRALVLASVIFTIAMLSIYVVVITFGITFPVWNEPPKENVLPITLPYPDTLTISMPNGTDFVVTFTMRCLGVRAENTPIQIVNASCVGITPESLRISVGFSESILTKRKNVVSSGAGIIGWSGTWALSFSQEAIESNASAIIRLISPEEMNEIYFPVAGDYSPIMLVNKGGSTTQHTYDQIKVHVQPESEVESANVSRLSLGLTWAFLGFSYIGVILAVYELVLKQENKNQTIVIINDLVAEPEIKHQLSEQKITISPPDKSAEKANTIKPNNKNTNGESVATSEPKLRKPRPQKSINETKPE